MTTEDSVGWEPHVRVAKYSPDQMRWVRRHAHRRRVEGDELATLFSVPEEGWTEAVGNSLTEAGALNMARVLAGDPQGVAISRVTTLVGVGCDPTANVGSPARHGALSPLVGEAPHTTFYRMLDKAYPQVEAPRIIRLQMTATENEAVFGWQEWGLALSPSRFTASGPVLASLGELTRLVNRKAVNLGVKEQGRSWVFHCSLRVG